MQVQPQRPPALLAAYAARPDRYDELCQRIGSVVVVRPHWREFHRALEAMPAGEPAALAGGPHSRPAQATIQLVRGKTPAGQAGQVTEP